TRRGKGLIGRRSEPDKDFMSFDSDKTAAFFKENYQSLLFYGIPALAILFIPLFFGLDTDVANIVLYIEIYMLLALGLNVVVGYTGLLDLGFVSFIAVGAVLTSQCLVLTVHPETGALHSPVGTTETVSGNHPLIFPFSYFIIMAVSGLFCAFIGVLRGIPTLRLSGDYFAIVTLGIAEIIFLILFNEEWISGGAFGIKLTKHSRPELFGEPLYWDTAHFYYLTFAILALTVVLMYRMQYSRLGRAWASIRLDETAARSCGVNVAKYKLIAFAVSGFMGGIGGSLYALWQGTVAVRTLEVWQSILVLCCIVLGGMGNIKGVLLGTGILMLIGELPRYSLPIIGRIPPEARFLVYGILIIMLMRFRPQGLIPLKMRKVDQTGLESETLRATPCDLFQITRGEAVDKAEEAEGTAPDGGSPS
ncbi:MAG: branched-chain amino acid ABC transporter permease, partial [Planctomycetota bacterium]